MTIRELAVAEPITSVLAVETMDSSSGELMVSVELLGVAVGPPVGGGEVGVLVIVGETLAEGALRCRIPRMLPVSPNPKRAPSKMARRSSLTINIFNHTTSYDIVQGHYGYKIFWFIFSTIERKKRGDVD